MMCLSAERRWAESELLDMLMRLEIGLAGRVEAWKATRWAAKLEQLKSKNDSLVSSHTAMLARTCTEVDLEVAPTAGPYGHACCWRIDGSNHSMCGG